MDEGNRADDEEFERYVDRFFKIFPANKDTKVRNGKKNNSVQYYDFLCLL